VFEVHNEKKPALLNSFAKQMAQQHWPFFEVSSQGQLSKYYAKTEHPLFVVSHQKGVSAKPIYQVSDLFVKYEKAKVIHRLYVAPQHMNEAKGILQQLVN